MRDITLSELQRLQPNISEADDTLQMDQEQLSEDDERASFQADPEIAERSERRRDLERAMAQLKPRQRDA